LRLEQTNLFDICRPKQWKTISVKQMTESGYPVYGANGRIGYYSEYNHEEPTLMITCRGATCGTINVSEPFSYITGNAMALDNLDIQRIELSFLRRYLEKRKLDDVISGTAQPQITREGLKKITIPLPSLSEQKRISTILDKADTLREKRRQAFDKLDELLQSIFFCMFGDPMTNPRRYDVVKLGDLGDGKKSIVDGPFGSAINVKRDYIASGDIPVVRTKNVAPFKFIFDDLKYISKEKFKEVKRSEVLPEDIILTKVGTVGNVCFFPSKLRQGVLSTTGSARIRPNQNLVDPKYLAFQLHILRPRLQSIVATAVQAFLNMTHIKTLEIMLPGLDEQRRFGRAFTSIFERKIQLTKSLKILDTLFASLQQRAFYGEL